jgi:hypothetical protein
MKLAGGCLCGKVRYAIDGEQVFAGSCHCRDCQKLTGGGYLPVLAFAESDVTLSGAPKYYTKIADSGKRGFEGFCPECGSRVCAKSESMAGLILVTAGTLDDPAQFRPQMHVYASRAQAWDLMDPAVAQVPLMPPGS